MASSEFLPSDDEREWLLTSLRELIEAAGWERFVSALGVFPSEEYFPDRWTADAFGVRRIALRLLRYVGLSDLEVDVEVFEGDQQVSLDAWGRVSGTQHRGAAAWFAGIDDGVCLFGTATSQLGDSLGVVAAMGHEVAHAFRRYHQLEVEDRDEEELLTDLTTVFLGFGILTTNASSRHRSSAELQSWSHQALGYLPPQALAFLLGVWSVARGVSDSDNRRIASALEANQAAYFRASLEWVRKHRSTLPAELGLPPQESWPTTEDFALLTAPIHDGLEEVEEQARSEALAAPGMNAGQPVFRVRRTRAIQLGVGGLMLGVVLAAVLARFVGPTTFPVLVAITGALGLLLGSRLRADRCSDPDCHHPLLPTDRVCPRCDGEVRGEIARERDRLGAEEALADRSPMDEPPS